MKTAEGWFDFFVPQPPSVQKAVPIIALMRFVAKVFNKAVHIRHAHSEGGSGLGYDIFLDHDAAQVVRAETQGDLSDVRPLGNPRALHIGNVVEINP